MKRNKLIFTILAFSLFLSIANACLLEEFSVESEINLNTVGGFRLLLTNSTENETIAGLEADVVALTSGNMTIRTFCKYDDEKFCFKWATNVNGDIFGTFYVDDTTFVKDQIYILQVSACGYIVTQNFTVITYAPMNWLGDRMIWFTENIYLIIGFLLVIVIVLFLIKVFTRFLW